VEMNTLLPVPVLGRRSVPRSTRGKDWSCTLEARESTNGIPTARNPIRFKPGPVGVGLSDGLKRDSRGGQLQFWVSYGATIYARWTGSIQSGVTNANRRFAELGRCHKAQARQP
jgi:hypothetical protein